MSWRLEGFDAFEADMRSMGARLERLTTTHSFFSAKEMQQNAMQNMGDMRIGLITGRSRALYGAALRGMIGMAGYLVWPEDVEFYPAFLNNGTSRMMARPFHDLAFEQTRDFFYDGMARCLAQAMAGGGR